MSGSYDNGSGQFNTIQGSPSGQRVGTASGLVLPRANSSTGGSGGTTGLIQGQGLAGQRVGTAGTSAVRGSTPSGSSTRSLFSSSPANTTSNSNGSSGGLAMISSSPISIAAIGVRSDRDGARKEREERQRERLGKA